ncbi:MAG: transposase, partial [Planctomycetes bacterium]|nr:transposase [Planctomycetota bacterium]
MRLPPSDLPRRLLSLSSVPPAQASDLYLIRPSEEIHQILLYLLALKSKRYRLKVHHFCMMSSHFHMVVTDPEGRIPDFMREFLHESSKAIQE